MRLSDAEYAVALEAEEVRTALPAAALEVLTAAAAAAREPRHERLRTQLAALQAGEQLAGNGLVAARKLLLQVGLPAVVLLGGAGAGACLLACWLACCWPWYELAACVTAAAHSSCATAGLRPWHCCAAGGARVPS